MPSTFGWSRSTRRASGRLLCDKKHSGWLWIDWSENSSFSHGLTSRSSPKLPGRIHRWSTSDSHRMLTVNWHLKRDKMPRKTAASTLATWNSTLWAPPSSKQERKHGSLLLTCRLHARLSAWMNTCRLIQVLIECARRWSYTKVTLVWASGLVNARRTSSNAPTPAKSFCPV